MSVFSTKAHVCLYFFNIIESKKSKYDFMMFRVCKLAFRIVESMGVSEMFHKADTFKPFNHALAIV